MKLALALVLGELEKLSLRFHEWRLSTLLHLGEYLTIWKLLLVSLELHLLSELVLGLLRLLLLHELLLVIVPLIYLAKLLLLRHVLLVPVLLLWVLV